MKRILLKANNDIYLIREFHVENEIVYKNPFRFVFDKRFNLRQAELFGDSEKLKTIINIIIAKGK